MMKTNDKEDLFIPTIAQWGILFEKWHDHMVNALWKFGSHQDRMDAVQEVFLKVTGLSDHLHFEKPLTPKSEKCWYAFLLYHAKGILSHYRQRQEHFEPLKEWKAADDSLNEDERENTDDLFMATIDLSVFDGDRRRLSKDIRGTIEKICREAGICDRNIRAFIMNVLDERNGKEVIERIPEIRNANNLYIIRHRILNLLKASTSRFLDAYDELSAA